MEYRLFLVNFLLLPFQHIHCSNIKQVQHLYTKLFSNYNRKLIPLMDDNDTVKISCAVGIVSINNFDDLSGEIELTMLFYMTWIDERLKWNPSAFGGKTTLLVPPEDIWRPQLYVLQSFDKLQDIGNVSMMVRILSNGLVMWNLGNVLKIVCSVDVSYFPFDTQNCSMTLSGWAYTTEEVKVFSANDTVSTDYLSHNSQWTLTSATVMNYSITPTFPPSINIILTLKRQSDFYVVYIIFPMVFLGSINKLVFIMPANSGERTSVAVTTFLSFVVFMQMINNTVTESSSPMAYIFYYILFLMVYSSLIICLCVISLHIQDKENPVPPKVKNVVHFLRCRWFKRIGKSVVMLERKLSKVSKDAQVKHTNGDKNEENDKEIDTLVTWKLVGKTFDVYCFSALFLAFWMMTLHTFANLYFNDGFN